MRNQSLAINDNPLIQRSRVPVWLWISMTICPFWSEPACDLLCWIDHFTYLVWIVPESLKHRNEDTHSVWRVIWLTAVCLFSAKVIYIVYVSVWGDSVCAAWVCQRFVGWIAGSVMVFKNMHAWLSEGVCTSLSWKKFCTCVLCRYCSSEFKWTINQVMFHCMWCPVLFICVHCCQISNHVIVGERKYAWLS